MTDPASIPVKRQFPVSIDELLEMLRTGNFPQWMKDEAEERQKHQAACTHAGWSFQAMGRCCFKCGAFMVDWGD